MSPDPLSVIILAAGKGERMFSQIPKVLHNVHGVPMILSVLNNAFELNPKEIVVVLGYKSDQVKKSVLSGRNVQNLRFAHQKVQSGTGHAVSIALSNLSEDNGDTIVLSGDVPLLSSKTSKKLLQKHRKGNYSATMLTTFLKDPSGYGRILRANGKNSRIVGIVEDKDALEDQLLISEVNTGTYVFRIEFLREYLPKLKNFNAQNEYYLTDLFKMAISDKIEVGSIQTENEKEVMGVNTLEDLKNLEVS
ncbi:MAG: sugar phosphate nucleotidyltransferase [Nitrospinota bacterium]|nr:sugar phosphate nucleotidyltransferase [Nitrospinota bacterium]